MKKDSFSQLAACVLFQHQMHRGYKYEIGQREGGAWDSDGAVNVVADSSVLESDR